MSIHWQISHPDQLVTTTVSCAIEPGDAERYFAEVAAAGGMSYRKIIDLRAAPGDARLAEINSLMRCTEEYAKTYALGAIAIIVACDFAQVSSAWYVKRTKVGRPFRIVRDLSEAMEWLGPPLGTN